MRPLAWCDLLRICVHFRGIFVSFAYPTLHSLDVVICMFLLALWQLATIANNARSVDFGFQFCVIVTKRQQFCVIFFTASLDPSIRASPRRRLLPVPPPAHAAARSRLPRPPPTHAAACSRRRLPTCPRRRQLPRRQQLHADWVVDAQGDWGPGPRPMVPLGPSIRACPRRRLPTPPPAHASPRRRLLPRRLQPPPPARRLLYAARSLAVRHAACQLRSYGCPLL